MAYIAVETVVNRLFAGHRLTCTLSLDSLVAECMAVVDLIPKYNLVLSKAYTALDEFVSLTSKDIKQAVKGLA